ncbi:hypothetical protein TRAPUB_11890 [Trametes pubescens]|uniref:Uncharacterized protein n=1 Tax=Trametes pubescens TaxID=154538 RepID=A0A1M2VVF5_TRAPU|nr:hypothetical protein TRAPUB_11890 [Trametes pubescens]
MPSFKQPECTLYVEEEYAYYNTWQSQPPDVPDPAPTAAPAQAEYAYYSTWQLQPPTAPAAAPALAQTQPTSPTLAQLPASAPPQSCAATESFLAAIDLMGQVEKVVEERPQTTRLDMLALVAAAVAEVYEGNYGTLIPPCVKGFGHLD